MESEAKRSASRLTWRSLLHLLAGANLLMLLYLVIANQDTLALALIAILLVGLALLRLRNGLLGVIVVGILSADVAFWTLSGAVNNFLNGEHLSALLLPAYLGLISLASVVAAVGTWRVRRSPDEGAGLAKGLGLILSGTIVIITLVALIQEPREVETLQATAVNVVTEGMKFTTTELRSGAGEVTVRLTNEDLWWHTFTIDELGVDLQVPMGAERTITFSAEPGTYRFYCAIPGHDAAGMHGTITMQ